MGIVNFTSQRGPSAAPVAVSVAESDDKNIAHCPEEKEDDSDDSPAPAVMGHLKETAKDGVDSQEQVELLHTSSSSSSFGTSATMGDCRQPPSIGSSKADLCPDTITFKESNPWQNRTRLEKALIALIVIFFIAAVVFLALFLLVYFKQQQHAGHESDVCTSRECLETAAFISRSIDSTADPCEDFYQYACGGWIEKNPIPSTMYAYSNFQLILKDLQETQRDLLTENDPNALDGILKARTFFKSCEDTDAIDAKGVGPLLELLETGGKNMFPTLEPDWVDEGLTLTEILTRVGKIGNLGTSPVVTIGIYADQKDSRRNAIYFTQTGSHLPTRDHYLGPRNKSALIKYEQVYVDIMTVLGADRATAQRDAVDLVDFEIFVANATEPPELRRNAEALYNKLTVRNLTNRYPKFDWLGHLQRQFGDVGINISMDEEVVVNALQYYDNIFPVVEAAQRRTLMNYCLWRLVYPLLGLLNKTVRDIKTRFTREISGAVRNPERWKQCVKSTDNKFPDAAGRLYVNKKFSQHAKERVESMIRDLIDSFKEMLRESDWMTETTKKAALQKAASITGVNEKLEHADAIVYKVGYPREIMNDTALNEKTSTLNLTSDGYFHNHLELFLQKRLENLRKIRKPVNKNEWYVSAAAVNAFYHGQTNEIIFPAGILHRPFFSDQFLDALNYGGIGFVIGHEITHGFDDAGRGFDKEGNLNPWWLPEDLQRFQERVRLMVQQYSNFTEPTLGVKLNGRLTIGEDIADNGGLKEAYRAYRKLISNRGYEEPRLPVLGYTPDQLFFIGVAQSWCGNQRDKVKKIYLNNDYHSPMRFRVIGPLQNNADFSRVFNCPVGSYMNPPKKIHVW